MTLQQGVTSQGTRAKVVKLLLVACMVIDGIGMMSGISQQLLLDRFASGIEVTDEEATANDTRHAGVGMAQAVVYLVTAICWLVWLHRAYSNLRLMGTRQTDHKPGWAVGYWFVPLLNLFRPYQVTKELWLRSASRNSQEFFGTRVAPTLLTLWWGLWIACTLLGRALGRWSMRAETMDALQGVTLMGIGLDALGIVAAALAFSVVKGIDGLQRQAASAEQPGE